MEITGKDIGDIVEVYCGRCRLNLDASVAALDSGKVIKVMCRTCGNEMKFKPPVDPRAKKKKALEKLMRQRQKKFAGIPEAELKGPNPLRKMWDELTANVDARYARVYDEKRAYDVEEAVLHKSHGMGIIHAIEAHGLLKILFRKGFVQLPSETPDE